MNNYELIFTQAEKECYDTDIKGGRFNKQAYLNNQVKRTPKYWNNLIEICDLWELNYKEGSISEDNESVTESSDSETDEYADYDEEKPEKKKPLKI